MREFSIPFRFDMRLLISSARRKINSRVNGVSINLPFVTFNVQPDVLEKKVAREIVIRLAERRVLNAFECCDGCIEQALDSLQKIRSLLVDKQVELADRTDTALYLMIEVMGDAIRQFLTFEQRLQQETAERSIIVPSFSVSDRRFEHRESYFAALEMLRAHLFRCLTQVARIADMDIPRIGDHMRYDEVWQLEAYEPPAIEQAEPFSRSKQCTGGSA